MVPALSRMFGRAQHPNQLHLQQFQRFPRIERREGFQHRAVQITLFSPIPSVLEFQPSPIGLEHADSPTFFKNERLVQRIVYHICVHELVLVFICPSQLLSRAGISC